MMEEDITSLQGASAFPGPEVDPDEDLPMIVWLRGDEEIVDEFTMDAEAAMQALGIKRSRLTQISGRELRVGRIRIDRYTRAVYRPQDVAQYAKWTRATASHQKSSKAIELAAKKLDEQRGELRQDLQALRDELGDSLMGRLQLALLQQQRLQQKSREALEERLGDFSTRLSKMEALAAEGEKKLANRLAPLSNSIALAQTMLASTLESVSETREYQKHLIQSLRDIAEQVKNLQETPALIQAAHKAQAKLLRDVFVVQDVHGKALKEVLERSREREPETQAMPRRQIPARQRRHLKSPL